MVRTLTLAMKDWPANDKSMWAGLIRHAGPLDGNGALTQVRAITLLALSTAYERWLAWLMATEPMVLDLPPELRATPARLVGWHESLLHLAPHSRLVLIARTVRVLSAADPDADWSIQRHFLNTLQRQAKRAISTRKAGRILSSGVLLDAGRKLAGPLADAATTPLAAARLRRDGTLVAFLALLPIRRRALSELRLGHSILVTSTEIKVALSGDMTKSGQPWEAPVQATIEPQLRYYIDVVRPFLLSRGQKNHDMLWVGQKGEPLAYEAIGVQIVNATLRATGIRIPPHFFRDAAASTLARQSPGDARLIRPLLAHSSFGTAERHYIQAQGIETGRDHAAIVARLTKGAF